MRIAPDIGLYLDVACVVDMQLVQALTAATSRHLGTLAPWHLGMYVCSTTAPVVVILVQSASACTYAPADAQQIQPALPAHLHTLQCSRCSYVAASAAAIGASAAGPHTSPCAAAGYDFINSAEATAAEVMSAAGYNSVHYGKW